MKLKKNYVVRKIGSEFFAVAISSEKDQQMIKLNESAAFIFERCLQDFTPDSLVEDLMHEYEISREIATRDVEAILLLMKENGLL